MTTSVEALIKSATEKARARGKSRLAGIFAHPVGHSLSPAMQNAAFEAVGLGEWHYEAFDVEPRELAEAAASIKKYGMAGVNVSVPHKENIIEFLDGTDDIAGEIGAVNTILNSGGRLIGYNTDAGGFLKALEDMGFSPSGKTAFIVGAGGAAAAVAGALKSKNAAKIFVFDAVTVKAGRLAAKFGAKAVADAAEALDADIVINASSAGMKEGDPSPLTETDLSSRRARKGRDIFVYDLVYNRKTELLKISEALGFKTAGGLGMLLHQGAMAFEIWTGREAPVETMKKNLSDNLS